MQTDPQTTKSSNPKDVLAASEQRVLLHLIPSPALAHVAQALMDGARKYGPYNWRVEGVSAVSYLSATMRHVRDYLDGEECADDSGVHHLGHAMACLAILLDAIEVGNLVDDRPLPAPTSEIFERMKSGSESAPFTIEEQIADKILQCHELAPDNPILAGLADQVREDGRNHTVPFPREPGSIVDMRPGREDYPTEELRTGQGGEPLSE